MPEPCATGCRLRGWCGAEQRQLCVSVTRIKMKRWWQFIKHWTNAAQSIRYFMKMKWISTLIPKSVRAGSFADSNNTWWRRVRMKNIIWLARYTAEREKWVMWVATARAPLYLSVCWNTWNRHTDGLKLSCSSWTTTSSTKAGKHSAGWSRIRSSGWFISWFTLHGWITLNGYGRRFTTQ